MKIINLFKWTPSCLGFQHASGICLLPDHYHFFSKTPKVSDTEESQYKIEITSVALSLSRFSELISFCYEGLFYERMFNILKSQQPDSNTPHSEFRLLEVIL